MSNKPINEIPQWVRDYNDAGHQSSAGKAIKITMENIDSLKQQNQELVTRLYNLVNQAENDPVLADGLRLAITEARETLKKVMP